MSANSDEEILQVWYQFASSQPSSVDSYLHLLRDRQGKTLEEQCEEFGVSIDQFNRLRSMQLPRESQFASDAKRMADACHLSEPMRFVQAMVLARNLQRRESQNLHPGYQAAFDDIDDLDKFPDEQT